MADRRALAAADIFRRPLDSAFAGWFPLTFAHLAFAAAAIALRPAALIRRLPSLPPFARSGTKESPPRIELSSLSSA